jgi:hypothetical protein
MLVRSWLCQLTSRRSHTTAPPTCWRLIVLRRVPGFKPSTAKIDAQLVHTPGFGNSPAVIGILLESKSWHQRPSHRPT